jgi:hypothetical protein
MKNILARGDRDCIETSGDMLSGIFQRVVSSITKIATQRIAIYTTLSVLLQKIIDRAQGQTQRDFQKNVWIALQNGTGQTMEDCGTGCNLCVQPLGRIEGERSEGANIVPKNSWRCLKFEDSSKNFVIQTARHLLIESVNYLSVLEDVYDIEVEGAHHFSLSNGAIVHNCDALRYLCLGLPKITSHSSPEALERRYDEARYGVQNASMPAIFRDDLPNY